MSSPLSSDQINHLTPLLGSLARLIGRFGKVSDVQLSLLIESEEYSQSPEISDELRRWAYLLEQVYKTPSTDIRETVVESFLLRGIAEAPAILAVSQVADLANRKPSETEVIEHLSVSTTNINFGVLPAGKTSVFNLEVCGGPGQVIVDNPCIEINPMQFGTELTSLHVSVTPQTDDEEVLYDQLVLKSESGEIRKVNITVQWQEGEKVVKEEIRNTNNTLVSSSASVKSSSTVSKHSIIGGRKGLIVLGCLMIIFIMLLTMFRGNIVSPIKITPNALGSEEVLVEFTMVPTARAIIKSTPTVIKTATDKVMVQNTSTPTVSKITADYKIPHGKIVFTCQVYLDEERNQICIINADGTGFKQLTNISSNFYPSLSPDGKSVIFVSFRTKFWEIFELDLNNGEPKQITNNNGEFYAPEISPDGQYIVATKTTEGIQEIWIKKRDGGNLHPLVQMGIDCVDPTWSHDGQKILFACGQIATERQLYIIDVNSKNITKITNLLNIRGRSDLSPNGDDIATYIGPEWEHEIVLISNKGEILSYLTHGGNNLAPSFSPDGAWITFMSYTDNFGDNNGCEIYIMRNDGTNVKRLTNNNYCDWQPRWGP
jgi:TolB protein